MYDITVRKRALALLDQGLSVSEVSRRTGISRFAIREGRFKHVRWRGWMSSWGRSTEPGGRRA